jgi:hypothetical protein
VIEHTLKCLPTYWDAIERGEKTFDVRRDDRGFQKGDFVILQRLNESKHRQHEIEYDGNGRPAHQLRRKITYILTGGQFGIEPGYVILALRK